MWSETHVSRFASSLSLWFKTCSRSRQQVTWQQTWPSVEEAWECCSVCSRSRNWHILALQRLKGSVAVTLPLFSKQHDVATHQRQAYRTFVLWLQLVGFYALTRLGQAEEKHRGLSEKKMWRSYFTDVKTLRTYIYLLKLWSALTWCCDAKSIPRFSVYDVIKNPTRTYSFWYKSVIINLHTDIRCQSLQSDVHFKVASILVRSVCWSSSRCFLFFFHCSVSILSAFNQIHSGMKTVCFVCCSTILFGLRMTGLLFYLSQPQNVGYMHVVHKLAIAVDFVVGSSKHRMWLKVFDQSVFVCARSFWSGCCKRGLYWSWTCLTGMKQAQLKLSARSVQRSVQHLLWRRCANCPRLLMYTYVSHALACAGVAIACRHCSVRCWWFIVYCLHNI